MSITKKIGTLLSLMTLAALVGLFGIGLFLFRSANDAVLLVSSMMEMNLAHRIHLETTRAAIGRDGAGVRLERLVAAFDLFMSVEPDGEVDGEGAPSIDEVIDAVLVLRAQDTEPTYDPAPLIGASRVRLPEELRDEFENVRGEWDRIRPSLVLIQDTASNQLALEAATLEVDAQIEGFVRSLGRLQRAVGARQRANRARLFGAIGGVAVASLSLLGVGLWSTRRYVASPVRLLEEASGRVSTGDFSHRVPLVGQDELARLLGAFNTMSERLEDLVRRLEAGRRDNARIVESIPSALFVLGEDSRVGSVNRAAIERFGLSEDAFAGGRLEDLLPVPGLGEEIEHVRSSGRSLEGRLLELPGEGGVRPLRVSIRPLEDDGSRLLVVVEDLTELEQFKSAAERNERRYRQLFDNANDLVCTADLTGRFTSVNNAAVRISGYSRKEALNLRLHDLVAPEYLEVLDRMMKLKLEGKSRTVYEIEIISKDGKRVPLELSTRLTLEDGKPIGVEGIARDASERRRLEEQLWLAQKMDAVGRLAGGIAHDFGNVLTIVTGYCALLLDTLAPDDPVREQVEGIKKATDRGTSLTKQLLSFSRGQFVQRKLMPLNAAVSEQADLLWRVLGDQIVLATILSPKVGLVQTDPAQLGQVVMNLALNARDAMPEGGQMTLVTGEVSVDESSSAQHGGLDPGRYFTLEVRDTGKGMGPEVVRQVFEPFYSTKSSGTGLGLSTVYGIVKQSGGTVIVDSELDRGTRVRVYLPHAGEMEATESIPDRPEELRRPESATVLLVDDEETVRRLVAGMIRSIGYEVIEARDQAEAIGISGEHEGSIDMLLTDVVMPEMSGPELAEQVRSIRPDIKVVFMSGYTGGALNYHVGNRGEIHFLQKPFSPESIASKIREVLEG